MSALNPANQEAAEEAVRSNTSATHGGQWESCQHLYIRMAHGKSRCFNMGGGVSLDPLDSHSKGLLAKEFCCQASIIDKDKVEQMEYKTKVVWTSSWKNYEEHHALLLCYTENWSGMPLPKLECFIFSCVVVWVPLLQSLYWVLDAISWLKK